jgi:predicted ATP-grasp superfamily ATP-dependent carboligase
MRVVDFVDRNLEDALLLVGFPAQDAVGGIAANYLIKALRLQLAGAVHDDDFPPSVAVQDDVGTSLMPVYAGDLECGPGGRWKRLVVVKSDLVLDPEFFSPLASSLLDWAEHRGVRTIVSMEGMRMPDRHLGPLADPGAVQIHGLASLEGRELLRELGLPWLRHATFTGFGAALMMKANASAQPAVCVFTTTPSDRADARAAAKLLHALGPLLPNTSLDGARVERKTEELEAQIRLSNEEHLLALQRMGEGHSVMYV